MTDEELHLIKARRDALDELPDGDYESDPVTYRRVVETSDAFWNHIEDDEVALFEEIDRLKSELTKFHEGGEE